MASLLDGYDRSRIPLWLAAIALGAALAFVVYRYIGTFVLGLFVYYITRPIHRRIADWIPTSSLAAAVSLLSITLPIILLVAYTVSVAVTELQSLAGTNAEQLDALVQPILADGGLGIDNLRELVTSAVQNPEQYLGPGGLESLGEALGTTTGYLGAAGNALLHLFIVLALAFYLLRDDHKLAAWFRTELAGERTAAYAYLDAVDRNLKTIYFGNILNAFATAVLAAISYNALDVVSPPEIGVPSATLLGLLTGVGSLVPVVGMKIVYIPVALVLAGQAALIDPTLLWFPLVFAAVSLVIVDTIPDLVLRPYVSGRSLHTGSVMIAYIVGPLLFGWYGLFLGPLLLVLVVHFARIILPELVRGEPVTTRATAGNPLDPDDVIDVPEPEPVEPTGETDPETDAEADTDLEADVDEQPQQSSQPSDDGTVEDE
ncbi:AI-2E family transporter [Halococcus saccharolyticus]|uniref:Permease n=1 Tax=Halococcus saccharolyticus DSM 5350 TaxID=1227455 RepID=M0MIA4_9EURY|nr:AI-2E family transporter [Halococcus saccharolyticus]EMA45421.1 permease [Halococcus saccharolyticus DSM 5350]